MLGLHNESVCQHRAPARSRQADLDGVLQGTAGRAAAALQGSAEGNSSGPLTGCVGAPAAHQGKAQSQGHGAQHEAQGLDGAVQVEPQRGPGVLEGPRHHDACRHQHAPANGGQPCVRLQGSRKWNGWW